MEFRIKRYDPESDSSYFQKYEVPNAHSSMTVLEALFSIVKYIDGSLAFRYACRGAVCGSCAMKVNDDYTLACHTQLADLEIEPVTIEPLPNFPIIKDLVVDMDPFFEKYREIQPFMPSIVGHTGEVKQSAEERKRIARAVNCILCGACNASCPTVAMEPGYLGPAAITAAGRFAFDSRNPENGSNLKLARFAGFHGCMKIQRCTKACPKGIDPAERIVEVRRFIEDETRSEDRFRFTTSICGYCSTGCALAIYEHEDDTRIAADTDYTVNRGSCCPKGWEALSVLDSTDRATTPLLRDDRGDVKPVSWDKAIEAFARNFKEIQSRYGNESVAFISTGQMPFEEMALLGSLAKFGMGMIHGDGNTRQCMATAATAYKQAFGFDSPPFTYADFEVSDTLIFIGSNPVIAHPIMWERVAANRTNPVTIVIDPRRTETAVYADRHIAPYPKTELALLYGVSNILIQNDWIDRDFIEHHTNGFPAFETHVTSFDPDAVADRTGLDRQVIVDLAETIHRGKRVSLWWTMGVNQSHLGVRTAEAIINICLMTGNIGRPGTGPNSITGQANAMGSRLFSNTTSLLSGFDFIDPQDRETVSDRLGIELSAIPTKNSMPYNQILEGIGRGTIRGLWIIATNPMHSWISSGTLESVLADLDFLVVQDIYHSTETARVADLLLPAAGWGEKDGTFINSERRLGRVHKVSDPPGDAIADFEIFKRISSVWGCGEMFAEWASPEAVFKILQRVSTGTPCDISGIGDYESINSDGGIQWPYPEGTDGAEKERRLFEDGIFFHKDGRAKFLFTEPEEPGEIPDESYPFILLTGRGTAAQWHTQTRTSKSEALRTLYPPEVYVEINPDDAEQLGISDGSKIGIESRRGKAVAIARAEMKMPRGTVFMSMHYRETNLLTFASFDPHSSQPAYKFSAVKINRLEKL